MKRDGEISVEGVLYGSYQHCKALTAIRDTLNSKLYAKY